MLAATVCSLLVPEVYVLFIKSYLEPYNRPLLLGTLVVVPSIYSTSKDIEDT